MRQVIAAFLGLAIQPQATEQAGQVYDIVFKSVSNGETSDGSTSSSRTQNALVETVAEIRRDGLELIFSLPESTSLEERERIWQLPARVLKISGQPFKLLNAEDLKERNTTWRAAAGIGDEYCEKWFFTWTAVKIECDPRSVLDMLAPFDIGRDGLKPGRLYQDPIASQAAFLRTKGEDAGTTIFVATMPIDPSVVREARERSARIAAEINAPTVASLPPDLKQQMQQMDTPQIVKVDGVVRVVFQRKAGKFSREREVELTIIDDDQSIERQTTLETVTKTSRQH